jgi:hypothetical protein
MLVERGFGVVEGAPTDTDDNVVQTTAHAIGSFIRETNYGATYEVKIGIKHGSYDL